MSGHSKWANIKHHKGIVDAKKSIVFTKLAREITVGARQGGSGDPAFNSRLRLAIDRAKQANMPVDNIERAIKKGTGGGDDGANLEEVTYEGYGPGGAAIMVYALTDNRNRTASEIRSAFTKGGGNLGDAGSVAWLFETKAVVYVEGIGTEKAEEMALAVIDAGADDFNTEGGGLEITGPPAALDAMQQTVQQHGVTAASASVTMIPKTVTALDTSLATQTLRLLDRLEDLDDINQVYTNADFPDEVLESMSQDS
jgi:YebC/PmpR family DNA-binding regulatory protein